MTAQNIRNIKCLRHSREKKPISLVHRYAIDVLLQKLICLPVKYIIVIIFIYLTGKMTKIKSRKILFSTFFQFAVLSNQENCGSTGI